MSQVVFDADLSRTVQPRSCDQCYLRKTKCSRHLPCNICAASGFNCSYDRQTRYNRRVQAGRGSRASSTSVDRSRQRGPTASPSATSSPATGHDFEGESAQQQQQQQQQHHQHQHQHQQMQQHQQQQQQQHQNQQQHPYSYSQLPPAFVSIPIVQPVQPAEPDPNTLWPHPVPAPPNPNTPTNQSQTHPAPSVTGPVPVPVPVPVPPPTAGPTSPPTQPNPNLPFLLTLFLDRVHPSLPCFPRSYLLDALAAQRHIHHRTFAAMAHALAALALLQPVQAADAALLPALPADRAAAADQLLAYAANLHAHADFGERPAIESVATSLFLFACQSCKGNHNAARLRLREALALAEVLRLENPPDTDVPGAERDRRLRTALCLVLTTRLYTLQQDYDLTWPAMTTARMTALQSILTQAYAADPSRERHVLDGLSQMLSLVDFIDPSVTRCLKNECWTTKNKNNNNNNNNDKNDDNNDHLCLQTVHSLLLRYAAPVVLPRYPGGDAQHAYIRVTRHWMRARLWKMAARHGYVSVGRAERELQPLYAVYIARETVETCEACEMASLEAHGLSLIEKLYTIISIALQAAGVNSLPSMRRTGPRSPDLPYSFPWLTPSSASPSSSSSPATTTTTTTTTAAAAATATGPMSPVFAGAQMTHDDVYQIVTRFLAVFAVFRGGKHDFLQPFMDKLYAMQGGGRRQ